MERSERIALAYKEIVESIRASDIGGSEDPVHAFQEQIVDLRNRILVDLCEEDSVVALFAMVDIVSSLALEFGLPHEWVTMMFKMSFENRPNTGSKVMRFADLTEGAWEL